MSQKTLRTIGLVFALLASLGVGVGVAQERTKDKKPATFMEVHASIKKHYEAGSLGKALASTRELMGMLSAKRGEAILAAMPAAPEGYEIVPQKKAEANPFANALVASVGSVVTQEYRGANGRIRLTVTADSPMGGMIAMMFENPAMLGPDAELIKYEQCNAILKKEGQSWTLKILIGQTMIDVNFGKEDDEFGLKMLDQAAVTKLHRVITN